MELHFEIVRFEHALGNAPRGNKWAKNAREMCSRFALEHFPSIFGALFAPGERFY